MTSRASSDSASNRFSTRLFRKEDVQVQGNLRHSGAGEPAAGTVDGAFSKLVPGGLPVDFDLVVLRKHEPALLHARVGIGAEFGTVVVMAGHANLDDDFGGARVLLPIVF